MYTLDAKINQRRRLEAETTHEREERLQQLSDNQQRKLDTETTALRSRSPHNSPSNYGYYARFIILIQLQRVVGAGRAPAPGGRAANDADLIQIQFGSRLMKIRIISIFPGFRMFAAYA